MGDGTEAVWTAQINNIIGGYIVTDYPHPLSEHDHRSDGDPDRRGYVIAECMTQEDAHLLAGLLNFHAVDRPDHAGL